MKKILKYTAFAAMVGLFSSCSDSFFEAESGDIITSDQMDEVDPVAGLNGMYAYLYKFDTMGYGDEAQHYDYGYHHMDGIILIINLIRILEHTNIFLRSIFGTICIN